MPYPHDRSGGGFFLSCLSHVQKDEHLEGGATFWYTLIWTCTVH